MFYPNDMTKKEAHDWAFNPDWKPCPVRESREDYDKRLSDKPPKMRDYHWSYYKWIERMSSLTPEERFQSWVDLQDWLQDPKNEDALLMGSIPSFPIGNDGEGQWIS
jgi:hypothetical protein